MPKSPRPDPKLRDGGAGRAVSQLFPGAVGAGLDPNANANANAKKKKKRVLEDKKLKFVTSVSHHWNRI